ncbi:tetratricopeptide repeat protein [Chryseolinea lacunae]|uniref:Tetratricopeptide repeat protein n=1 Tax=Chryseolinea lacunae TaxID=2801331 RepID=A0ABS1KWZ9_9BACT|nr:tetratricopeptide repeat protein [Chryseolinea lacunae]MBL0743986.1 tetratricopeptide repeat protein [Chryseolinea lacunae]
MVRLVCALLLLLLLLSLQVKAASQADSLRVALQHAKSDEERMRVSLALADKIYNSDPFQALEYAAEAVRLARKFNADSSLIAAYSSQAKTYLHLGNYSRALEIYQVVIHDAGERKDLYWLAVGYGNMGSVYYFQRDHENALKYYLLSLDQYIAMTSAGNDKRTLHKGNLLNNIGIIYSETGEYEKATRYYSEAYTLSKETNDFEMMANVLNNQGTLAGDQGDNALAYKRYNEALELRKKNHDMLGLARSNNNLGNFYIEHYQDDVHAEPHLKEAIAIGQSIAAWQVVSSSSNLLYGVYKRHGKYKEALETLELHRQVRDSLFNEESTRKIAQLEMQFEFDKQQRELEASQKEKELYFWSGVIGLVLLLVIVSLLFILQRNKTRRSELEQAHLKLEKVNLQNDLVLKDKELTTNIMNLLNKNELINAISEKLLDLKQHVAADLQGPLQKVVLDLQSNLQPELWQEFEVRFQQVHEQFYKTLHEKFPDLSPHEVRLCAFLKLNMTTKEISAITHQNAKSIDVARTRLRKKLNLTGTEHNLVTFLSQIDKSV